MLAGDAERDAACSAANHRTFDVVTDTLTDDVVQFHRRLRADQKRFQALEERGVQASVNRHHIQVTMFVYL